MFATLGRLGSEKLEACRLLDLQFGDQVVSPGFHGCLPNSRRSSSQRMLYSVKEVQRRQGGEFLWEEWGCLLVVRIGWSCFRCIIKFRFCKPLLCIFGIIWHIFDKPKKFASDFNYELSYVAVIRTGQPSPHWLLADPPIHFARGRGITLQCGSHS